MWRFVAVDDGGEPVHIEGEVIESAEEGVGGDGAGAEDGEEVFGLPNIERTDSDGGEVSQAVGLSASQWGQILCHGGFAGTDQRPHLTCESNECAKPALAKEECGQAKRFASPGVGRGQNACI